MIYLVDPLYNPNFRSEITSSTALAPGITIAKFLGARGTRVQFENLTGDRTLIARQLYLQAEAMRSVISNKQFSKNRLIVAEGVYKPAISEVPTGINDYKQTGRAIVYQLFGRNGEIDLEMSFDLAEYWKDYQPYQEMILDYDTFDPSGKLSCQIILIMPVANETFNISFDKTLSTTYNGALLSKNELLEVLPSL
jgi:hypothetical protein